MIVKNLKPQKVFTCYFDLDVTINWMKSNQSNSKSIISSHKVNLKKSSSPIDLSNQNNINCIGVQDDFLISAEVKTLNSRDITNY